MGAEDNKGFDLPQGTPVNKHLEHLKQTKSNSIVSVDFDTAISKSGFGKFNVAMLVLAVPAVCSSSFSTGSMSFVIPAASEDLGLTPTSKAVLQSASYAGMICGGFLWGLLSDTFGRKKLIAGGFLIDFVMNTFAGVSYSLPVISLFKFLSGFIVCGPYSIFMAYISEVFDSSKRDIAVMSTGVFDAIGSIVQAGLAMLTIPASMPDIVPLKSWQVFHVLCGLPSLICGLAFLFCVESPKFLMEKGNKEAALKVCQKIYTINTGKDVASYPVKRLHAVENKKKSSKLSDAVQIFKRPYVQRVLLFFLIQFGQTAMASAVRLWLPELLTIVHSSTLDSSLGLCPLIAASADTKGNSSSTNSVELPRNNVYIDMMIVNVGTLLGHIVFMLTVSYLGRKKILIASAFVAAFLILAIPRVSADQAYLPASAFIAIVSIIHFSNISLVVSVFPTKLRATSVSLTLLSGRIGVVLANYLISKYIYNYCHYYFFALATIAIGITSVASFLSVENFDDTPQREVKTDSSTP